MENKHLGTLFELAQGLMDYCLVEGVERPAATLAARELLAAFIAAKGRAGRSAR